LVAAPHQRLDGIRLWWRLAEVVAPPIGSPGKCGGAHFRAPHAPTSSRKGE